MHNIDWKVTADQKLVITIDIGKRSVADAPRSSTGLTKLVASTGRAQLIPSPHCREMALQLNLMAKT